MKYLTAVALFFLSFWGSWGQNLVPNPSFEEYTECWEQPGATNQTLILRAEPWFTPNCSTDWFHGCHPFNGWWGVPDNFKGYQMPRTGEGYAGMVVIPSFWAGPPNPESREYLEVELLSPLQKDSVYRVALFTSLSNFGGYTACDCIGVFFSESAVIYDAAGCGLSNFFFDTQPQLITPEGHFMADTMEWMELCWIYQAKDGEKFITIGSFEKRAEMNLIGINGSGAGSGYYYFDDISVEKVPWHEVDLALPDEQVYCLSDLPATLTAQDSYASYLWSTGDTS